MDYKKLLKSRDLRFKILNILKWIPDRIMLPIQYYIKMGRKCNLTNPQRWTEKIQLYKMNYRNPILHKCVDKYEVREFVRSKGCGESLIPLYGVWENAHDIDFESLPPKFVLKTTNGGGGLDVYLIKNKNNIDQHSIVNSLNHDLKIGTNGGREWAYSGISVPRIICEELLINKSTPEAGVEDFKILCFKGIPHYIIVDKDRYTEHKRNFYTPEWDRVNITTDHEQFESDYPKPKNLEGMLDVARKLSADFPFVRVDLYNIDGKIFFGELTFYPWSGYVQFTPDSFDFELGQLIDTVFN